MNYEEARRRMDRRYKKKETIDALCATLDQPSYTFGGEALFGDRARKLNPVVACFVNPDDLENATL